MDIRKIFCTHRLKALITILVLVSVLAGCAAAPSSQPAQTSPGTPARPSTPSTGASHGATTSPSATTPPAATSPGVSKGAATAPEWKAPYSNDGTIGLAVGGAKDIDNFRENINNNYLPIPTDITYEGLFYDYYFDTNDSGESNKLFYPGYSCATTRDPLSGKTEYYLSVGLNSGMKENDFKRKHLNMVIVLDISGSMSSAFDEYYYDRSGIQKHLGTSELRRSKIAVAEDAIITILDQLDSGDRLGIVLFNDRSYLLRDLERFDYEEAVGKIRSIRADGSTNLSAGMKLATDLFADYNYAGADPAYYENRIIFLTDAMPNKGETGENSLLGILKRNANNRLYTTFIGIGVDFNTELVEYVTKVRGANYYSVHSPGEFAERMSNFDYMVTPLVFNLKMRLDADGWDIEKVYGSPEADRATGNLMWVNTLFPSEKQDGQTKGGLILLKLKRQGKGNDSLKLRVTYEDRTGRTDSSEATIYFDNYKPEYFENEGIRKGILLARYADLVKDWILDERDSFSQWISWSPRVDMERGICPPPDNLGTWERKSLPLKVSTHYRSIFKKFASYFANEADEISDATLGQELDILALLSHSRG
jgi:Ca-activated chloride channel family protein